MLRKMPWLTIVGLVTVLIGIVGYNIWAYNCGYCAIQDMKVVGPQVKGIGFLVLGAATCWLIISLKRKKQKPADSCTCGRQAAPGWSYCPDCGRQLK